MDVSRRGFLVGFAAVSLTAAAGPVLSYGGLPVLYGDGIHDDADALEAALNGRPFIHDGVGYVAATEHARIVGGRYRLSRTVEIGQAARCEVLDAEFLTEGGWDFTLDEPLVTFRT